MFKRRDKETVGRIDTLIGRSASVQGDVEFAGGLHLDGRITGSVRATAGSDSSLSVSEHGVVEAPGFASRGIPRRDRNDAAVPDTNDGLVLQSKLVPRDGMAQVTRRRIFAVRERLLLENGDPVTGSTGALSLVHSGVCIMQHVLGTVTGIGEGHADTGSCLHEYPFQVEWHRQDTVETLCEPFCVALLIHFRTDDYEFITRKPGKCVARAKNA